MGLNPKEGRAEHHRQLQAQRNDQSSDPQAGGIPGSLLRECILIMRLLRAGITAVCEEQAAGGESERLRCGERHR